MLAKPFEKQKALVALHGSVRQRWGPIVLPWRLYVERLRHWRMIMIIHYFPHPTLRAMFLLDEIDDDLSDRDRLGLDERAETDVEIDRYWAAVGHIETIKSFSQLPA